MARVLSAMLLLLVSGCAGMNDPFEKPYTWRAQGDNAANLRAMIADPQDLERGRGETASLGAEAGPPVTRLFQNRRFPLPDLSASGISTAGPGAAAPAAPPAPQGGSPGGANAGP